MRYVLKREVNECRDFHLICQTTKGGLTHKPKKNTPKVEKRSATMLTN